MFHNYYRQIKYNVKEVSIDNNEILSKIIKISENDQDIDNYFFDIEMRFMVDIDCIRNQSEITERMRFLLVDWVMVVHSKIKFHPYTLYLSINMIDRYIKEVNIKKSNLWLVGITCLYLAGKYEERYFAPHTDFIHISGHEYSKEQLFNMEKKILNTLNFSLTAPSSLYFLNLYIKQLPMNDHYKHLCYYILELCLLDFKMNKFRPSTIAYGSILISNVLKNDSDTQIDIIKNYIKCKLDEFLECIIFQIELINQSAEKNHHAFKKYSSTQYNNISSIIISDEKIEIIKSLFIKM